MERTQKPKQDTALPDEGRQDWIDLVKFLAILIVMINHVGLDLPIIKYWGGMFYVPVFFVLSGFVWHPKKIRFREAVQKKAMRLILPFVVTNLILILLFLVLDLVRGDLSGTALRSAGFAYARNQLYSSRDTLYPGVLGKNLFFMTALNSPTWFLPALFLTDTFTEALFRLARRKHRTDDLFAMLVIAFDVLMAITWNYLTPMLLPWSLDAIPFFMAFFFLGYYLRSQGGWKYLLERPVNFVVMFVILFVGGTLNGSANFSIGEYGQSVMLANLNAMLSSVLILFLCYLLRGRVPKPVSHAGKHTLSLLCWHFPLLTVLEAVRSRLFSGMGEVSSGLLRAFEIVLTIVLILLADAVLARLTGRFHKGNIGENTRTE